MVKHIVMWSLKNKATAPKVKSLLEGLKNKIPSVIDIEVGIDYAGTEASSDVVLYSTFANKDGLDAYQNHPEHQAIVPIMKELTIPNARKAVDYEI